MKARLAVLALAVLPAVPALSAPCAGFNDVQDTDNFCTAVEWIRNRSITIGCGPSLYCPWDSVSRSQMALFLNRLGTRLSPEVAFVENSLAAVDLDNAGSLCATAAIAAAPYPRRVLISITFGGQSAGDLGFSVRPLVSADGGATFAPVTAQPIRESVVGSTWTNATTLGVHSLPASQSVQFALGLTRDTGMADFTQARCQLIASVVNANGTSPPF
ncbi:MAG TPA: hypothetical protein VNE58_17265 [Casimicrobiaceae bacterium]|nr:hypothetical protein [Casimicrobiaceae bacterium]